MARQVLLSNSLIAILLLLSPMCAIAQEINSLKSAVVKIRNTKTGEVGAGFIITVDKNLIYIVTASHVVRSNENPEVYLYNRQQQDPLVAKLRYREDESQKGLALLTLRSTEPKTFSGITSVNFGRTDQLEGGEPIRIIGFPNDTPFWSVNSSTVSRVEGNYLIFGSVKGGNSGGPVILNNGQVIGMVTDTIESQGESSAAKAEIIVSYVNGLVPNLISIDANRPTEKPKDNSISNNEFCRALGTLSAASKNRFESIKGERAESDFFSTLAVPDSLVGYIRGRKEVYYYFLVDTDKQKIETKYNKVVSELRLCLADWQQKEVYKDYRYYKFRESKNGTVMSMRYNLQPQNKTYYYLSLIVYPPGNGEW